MDATNHQTLEVCGIGFIVNGMNFVPVTTRMGTQLMPTIKRHCKHFQLLFTTCAGQQTLLGVRVRGRAGSVPCVICGKGCPLGLQMWVVPQA